MSCFRCTAPQPKLIDEILERGYRLRSAIVRSILNNEATVTDDKCVKSDINRKIISFLNGDPLDREDELATLETLRAMSPEELSRIWDRKTENCECPMCQEFDQKSVSKPNEDQFKLVDSLKITVHSVALTSPGEKQVNSDKFGGTFFLEFQVPKNDVVRMCARRRNSAVISFKQLSVHNFRLRNFDATIKFHLSFRHFKQKKAIQLGVAEFDLNSFRSCKNFTCNQELTIRLSELNPIIVGVLKISAQLGCGRLYFGKEFFEAITNNKENFKTLDSDLSPDDCDTPFVPKLVLKETNSGSKADFSDPVPHFSKYGSDTPVYPQNSRQRKPITKNSRHEPLVNKAVSQNSGERSLELVSENSRQLLERKLVSPNSNQVKEASDNSREESALVLFGLTTIISAEFAPEISNSYFSCQLFDFQNSVNCHIVAFGSKPVYNFSQQIPLIYDQDLLLKLRENYLVIEFFEKNNVLIGLSKINLHQLYLSYRNPIIVKYLVQQRLPIIASDGWELITNPKNDEVVGKVQTLIALGTREQIENLQKERQNSTKTVDVGIQSNMEQFLNKIISQKSPNTDPQVHRTDELLTSLHQALTIETKPKDSFKVKILIKNAMHLPSRRKCKARNSRNRNSNHEVLLPSTYVTFQDHEGVQKMTPIAQKTTSPKWETQFDDTNLSVDLLTEAQKFLIFKVWRKGNNVNSPANIQTDHVIGFAAVDLTVLAAGLPSIQGWYNINDLSKKKNGQINIEITPLEDVTQFRSQTCCSTTPEPPEPGELLGRALKRKFTELDEITQRLRLRLSKVTSNDESDTSNDDIADEFERDINTLCVEDDFDMVNFEQKSSEREEEIGLLKLDEREKIDNMLEKLSLVSGETSSRYVSGCSDGRVESILKELDTGSRPNLYSAETFEREMGKKFGE